MEVQAGVTLQSVETSFTTTSLDGSFTVTLGDLYAEEKKDLLVKLQVLLHQCICLQGLLLLLV